LLHPNRSTLDMGRVKKVDLYENGTIAIVEAVSP
jgi:cell division protease FtsH